MFINMRQCDGYWGEKIKKNNFLSQNDQFFTKRVEIFRKHFLVILKGFHWQKLEKSFHYGEIIRK